MVTGSAKEKDCLTVHTVLYNQMPNGFPRNN